MSELWFWRSNDRVRGPLATGELEGIVLNNRLGDSDAVRLDGTDEWIPAADIRRMFVDPSSASSPSATAEELLKSAAARRLQGSGSARPGSGGEGLTGRLIEAIGRAAGGLVEFVARFLEAIGKSLGSRGRTILTTIAAGVILIYLASLIPWDSSDEARLTQIQTLWNRVKVLDSEKRASLPAETVVQLRTLENDLSATLREQPVSGSSGSGRMSALARREMLFAVRGIQELPSQRDQSARDRIEGSLETARDYLSGSPAHPKTVDRADRSMVIIAVIILDIVLVVLFAGWWVMGRGRG